VGRRSGAGDAGSASGFFKQGCGRLNKRWCSGWRYDDDVQELRRITINPAVMGGKACIRGMRVTVGMIVEAVAAGRTVQGLLSDFPYLEHDDIREALTYAASLAQGREVQLAS
jgi:uncharacterized protein (DUF433 family)